MIYLTTSATVVPGKEEEAKQWMTQFTQYGKAHYAGETQLCQHIDGLGGRYTWLERHDSLAAYEADDIKWQADPEIKAMLKKAEGLFTDLESHFWRVL